MAAADETRLVDRCWRWFAWVAALAGTWWWARRALVAAALSWEDGTWLFERHYQELSVAAWFEPWNWYQSLLPNVLASLACRLPAPYVPHGFAIVSWLLLVIACTRPLDRRFAAVAPLPARVAVVVALAWLPIGDWALSTCLMYSQSSLMLWLTFLLLRPRTGGSSTLDCVLVALLTWSHPLAVGLVPISLWRLREAAMRPVAIVHVVTSVAYYLFGRVGGEARQFDRLGDVPEWFAVRIAFEPLLGTSTQIALYKAGLGWLAMVVGAGILVLLAVGVRCAWPRWQPMTRQLVLGMTWMAVMSVAAAVVLRDTPVTEEYATRYPWPGRTAFVTIVVLVLTTFVRVQWALILIAAWGPWLARFDWRYHPGPRPPEFSAFLQQVAAEEERLGGRRNLDVRFERPEHPRWSIQLKPR